MNVRFFCASCSAARSISPVSPAAARSSRRMLLCGLSSLMCVGQGQKSFFPSSCWWISSPQVSPSVFQSCVVMWLFVWLIVFVIDYFLLFAAFVEFSNEVFFVEFFDVFGMVGEEPCEFDECCFCGHVCVVADYVEFLHVSACAVHVHVESSVDGLCCCCDDCSVGGECFDGFGDVFVFFCFVVNDINGDVSTYAKSFYDEAVPVFVGEVLFGVHIGVCFEEANFEVFVEQSQCWFLWCSCVISCGKPEDFLFVRFDACPGCSVDGFEGISS